MKIKLNYDELAESVGQLQNYQNELLEMRATLAQSKENIDANNSGEAIVQLINNLNKNIVQYDTVIDFVDDLIDNMQKYYEDINSYVQPINSSVDIKVDEGDVLKNIEDIEEDTLKDGWVCDGYLQNAIDDLSASPFGFSFDEEEISKLQINETTLRNMKKMIEANTGLLSDEIYAMKTEHKKLGEFTVIDENYGNGLSRVVTDIYEDLENQKSTSSEIDIDIDYENLGVDLTNEEKAEVEKEIRDTVLELSYLGWSKDEIEAYLNNLDNFCVTDGRYETYLAIVRRKNKESKTVGSDIFNAMLGVGGEDISQEEADRKLKVVKSYYDLELPQSESLSSQHNSYYDLINNVVQRSSVFDNVEQRVPTELQYFVHTVLRKDMNDTVISSYGGGHDGLEAMFGDGWIIAGYPGNDSILNASRYHQIGDIVDPPGYNPKYNIKVLSKDKKFERIYNTQLGMFLDEIVVTYESELNVVGVGIVTNAETYNYGYDENGKDITVPDRNDPQEEVNGHTFYDVDPYNNWGTNKANKLEKKDKDLTKEKLKDDYGADGYMGYIEEKSDTSYGSMVRAAEKIVDVYNGYVVYWGEPGIKDDLEDGKII